MDKGVRPLVCDKCGHFDWSPLEDKIKQAIARHRIATIWVPCEVRAHMQQIADHQNEVLGAIPERIDSCTLFYRGVEVKGLTPTEEYPTPNSGEMYLVVQHNGRFLYMWVE